MKRCCKCRKLKSILQYNFKNKTLEIRQKACKSCTRKEIRNHYYSNRQYYLNKSYKRNKIIREALTDYIWHFLLSHPCVDCGESDPVVLEFDHQRDKVISISQAIHYNYTVAKLQVEIAKCVVRCANCHRKKTAKELGWYKGKLAPVA